MLTGKQHDDRGPYDAAAAVLRALSEQRIMAIVRASDAERALAIASGLIDAGLRVVEVSMGTPRALDVIARLVGRYEGTALIGVGTVLDAETVCHAAAIGAQFIVAPTLNPDVVMAASAHGLASFPGCATPSEMEHASRLGTTGIKVFPASLWRPQALSDVIRALPSLRCVPTGGIGLDDLASWLDAGAIAVGLGSALAQGSPAVVARARAAVAGAACGGSFASQHPVSRVKSSHSS